MVSTLNAALSVTLRRLALISLLVPLAACDKPAPPPPPPAEVTAVKVEPQTVPESVQFVAQVESSHQVEILARVSGFLDKIAYKEGDLVKAGQVMFQIDPKPFQAAVAAAKGEVENRQAQLWTAKANLDRVKPLAALDATSKSDLDNAIGSVQAAEAALYSAKANLDKAQLDLGYTTIHAPVNGVSGQAFFREGTYLNASVGERMSYVAKLDPIWVTFSLSQNQLTQRQQEMAAGQLIPPPNRDYLVDVELSDGTRFPNTGRLNFISPTFNQETGSFMIRAEFANPDGVLRPGMFVKATVKGAVRPNTLVVPQKAVQETSNGHVIYIATPDGKAEIRPVIVGAWVGNNWIIKQGLKAGEQVIVDGFQRLAPGTPVKVKLVDTPVAMPTPAAPAPAPAPAAAKPLAPTPAVPKPAVAPAPPTPAAPAKSLSTAPAPTNPTAVTPAAKPDLSTKLAVARQPAPASGQLVLGTLADYDQANAKQIAAELEKLSGQPVTVRTYESHKALADWFLRYRAIDLAIIPGSERGDLLAGNYLSLQQLPAAAGRPDRLVARHDLSATTLKRLSEGLASHRPTASSQVVPMTAQAPLALAAQ